MSAHRRQGEARTANSCLRCAGWGAIAAAKTALTLCPSDPHPHPPPFRGREQTELLARSADNMHNSSNRIIVIGAGPVGLCLSLALAQDGIEVCLIEALGDDNFLEQVPRAGTNHPATLELFDRIGLYQKLEPRGIVAPLFHYWDRHENKLIAAFDHIHLKDDTRFPYVLQCERIKIVEEAMRMAKADALIDLRLRTTFTAFDHDADGITARMVDPAGEEASVRGAFLVSCEGARSVVRKELGIEFEGFTYADRTLNIEVAYDFRRYGYTERNYISDPDE